MDKSAKVKWADAPAEHDYPAAASDLRLLTSPESAAALAGLMSKATTLNIPSKTSFERPGFRCSRPITPKSPRT